MNFSVVTKDCKLSKDTGAVITCLRSSISFGRTLTIVCTIKFLLLTLCDFLII